MTETLALRYRPHAFRDIVGQKSVKLILYQMVVQQKVPTGLLFTGVRGTGKTTTGRILGAALNCGSDQSEPCGECVHCEAIFAGTALDVLEIDAASHGNVDDVRRLTEQLRYSVGGAKRVVLLDEAHSMSREAFNALLKTLEEPPPDTVFILLTTEPGRILDTVRSRLMEFEFRRIGTSDIVERLRYIVDSEGFSVEEELLSVIAERSHGGLRDSIMTLDQVTRVGVKTVQDFTELLGETDFAPPILRAMAGSDLSAVFDLVDAQLSRTGDASAISSALIHVLRDVLVLQAGGTVPRQGEALAVRQELVALLTPDVEVAALRVLWDLKTKVRLGDDPRAILELAAVMVTEALVGKAGRPSAAPPTATRRLTLSEMRSM